ncbi:MAG TPA: DUF2378 family protein [Myxococcaceae bacterium]|nr:DUF2378 family protein [Myxococcaceae bacterium]
MGDTGAMIQGSMFEALFERRLKPDGAFLQDLVQAGYDPSHPEVEYPEAVLIRCIEVARRHAFPELSPKDGEFRVGQELSDGFLGDTLAGKVMAAAMPLVGPERIIRSLPRRFKSGTDGEAPDVQQIGDRQWRVEMGHNATPYMVAGAIQAALARTGVEARVEVERAHPKCVLLATWSPKA